MTFLEFLLENVWVLLFYAVVILVIFLFRKKFDMQGIVALYRTKVGLKSMDDLSKKHRELIKLLGYIGIGVAYVGLFIISTYLIYNLFQLIFVPKTASGVSLVVPGVKIPGAQINIPLISGWIALFIIIFVHEFSHGVVAKAHGLKIKSSGILFLGPIMGAFVEPDEKEVAKKNESVQYSIFAAGPFSNILLAFLAFFIGMILIVPVISAITHPVGFSVGDVQNGFPAKDAGLLPNKLITHVNGIEVKSSEQFYEIMQKTKPNETISLLQEGKQITIKTTTHPQGAEMGYIGVAKTKNELRANGKNILVVWIYSALDWFLNFLELLVMLSLGIGLINLLPLGPVDGGRMLHLSLLKSISNKKRAIRIWVNVSIFFLVVLALNFFYPMFASMFSKMF